jgi:hypothetical protein
VGAADMGDSATWAGIDGFGNNDLVQAGTDQSQGTYYAWYELIPEYAFELGPVGAGDEMYVDIAQDSPTTWTVIVKDLTQGVTWSGPVAYQAAGTTAEWVEEAPTVGGSNRIEHLAHFATVHFTGMSVGGPGTASAQGEPVYLVGGPGGVQAYPQRYDPVTNSLTVSYGRPPHGVVGYPSAAIPSTTGAVDPGPTPPALAHGYWLAAANGTVSAFGSAASYGAPTPGSLGAPVTAMATTPDDRGYWLVTADGGVFSYGDAVYYGSLPGLGFARPGTHQARRLNARVVGIAPTVAGDGYLLVSADGGVFAFGAANFEGSCPGSGSCGSPAVGIVPDASGMGYWVLLRDARMVPFGDARAIPDRDCQVLTAHGHHPAVAAARTVDGHGYWVVLQNGTSCAEGDALSESIWEADAPTDARNPAVALVADQDGEGAWLVLSSGNVDRFGDAPRLGDLGRRRLASSITAAAGF